MRTRPRHIGIALALVVALCSLAPARGSEAADPFYERLLTEGTASYARKEHVRAVKQLRTAVFGLLDEPERLARGLCLLGLAQAALDDRQAFTSTFMRLVEIESRFEAYSKSPLELALRADYEMAVARLVPRAAIEATKSFGGVLELQDSERLAALRPADRRAELQKLLEQQQASTRWGLTLARLELEHGRPEDAVRAASRLLVHDPLNAEALLVRGLAHAKTESWIDAARDLIGSGRAEADTRSAEALLRALVELSRWADAEQFAASLPAPVRDHKRVRSLAEKAKAERQKTADSSKPVDSQRSPAQKSPDSRTSPDAQTPPASEKKPDQRKQEAPKKPIAPTGPGPDSVDEIR